MTTPRFELTSQYQKSKVPISRVNTKLEINRHKDDDDDNNVISTL